MHLAPSRSFSHGARRILPLLFAAFVFVAASSRAADAAKKAFDVPAGAAVRTLKQFAAQAGSEIVFSPEVVGAVKTRAVLGQFTPREALDAMLANTGLVAAQEQKTGAFAVRKGELPNGQRVAQSAQSDLSQTSAKAADETIRLGEFVVSGTQLSMRRALAEKRGEAIVSDAISADEIGSIPDFGLGEALERVPGVAMVINNGRGESQFATLRGLNADYNAVLIDGLQLPSTETNRRNVSLDVIPSSLAKAINVYKTFTPEMDGNAIGGIMNLRTRSAYDSPGFFISARGNYGFYENPRRLHPTTPSGQAELTLSNTFGARRQWGLVVSASYFRRDSSSLNSAIDTYSFYNAAGALVPLTSPEVGAATPVPDRRRWLAYDNVRERNGLFGKLEFSPTGALRAHVTGGFFQHLNDEERQSNILIRNSTPVLISPTAGTVAVANAQADYAGFYQDRRITYGEFGAASDLTSDSRVTFATHYAIGDYRQSGRLDTYRIANTAALGYRYETTPGGFAHFAPTDPAFYYNAANYRAFEHGWTRDNNNEKILTLALDYGHNDRPDARGLGFKTGLKYRHLDRAYDFFEENYRPTSPALLLADALDPRATTPYNGRGQRLVNIDAAKAQAVFLANRALYPLNPTNLARNLQADYTLNEAVTAAFALGVYRLDRFTAIGGARFERTVLKTASNATRTAGTASTYVPTTRKSDYDDLLPSLNLSYDLTSKLRVRGALSRSISRPNYDSLAAREVIADNGAGIVNISTGNPGLKPREAANWDASLEWYFSKDSLFSAGLFRKDLKNEFLRTAAVETAVINGIATTTTTTSPRNLDSARIDGIELAFTDTRLDFLPGPLAGLGVQLNATFLAIDTSSIVMANGSMRRLPSLLESPERTFNATLLYQIGKWNAQVSYKHTDPNLVAISTANVVDDRYYRDNDTCDAQLRYTLNRRWSFTVQAKNFTGERPARMIGLHQELLREELNNGRSWFGGVTYLFK
jgi:TonB-dependent receptor